MFSRDVRICLFLNVHYSFNSTDLMFYIVQAVADIIRTTLGPRSMLKMLLDAAGGVISHFLFSYIK